MGNLNDITSAVYEALFDKTQAELIAEANQHSPLPHIISGDEAMRDCLSVAALSALSRIESVGAFHIEHANTVEGMHQEWLLEGLYTFIRSEAKRIRSEYPNGTIPLWHDDTL